MDLWTYVDGSGLLFGIADGMTLGFRYRCRFGVCPSQES